MNKHDFDERMRVAPKELREQFDRLPDNRKDDLREFCSKLFTGNRSDQIRLVIEVTMMAALTHSEAKMGIRYDLLWEVIILSKMSYLEFVLDELVKYKPETWPIHVELIRASNGVLQIKAMERLKLLMEEVTKIKV